MNFRPNNRYQYSNIQANTEKPEWSEEEQQVRGEVLEKVSEAGGLEEAGLKKQIMVDRSSPVVGGKLREIW